MNRYSFSLILIFFCTVLEISAQARNDSIIMLEGIEVKDRALKNMFPVNMLDIKLLERNAVADLGEALRSQPNISGIRRGGYAIDPVIRGFRYNQINTFLDEGIHIEGGCPNRMDPILAHIGNEDIKKLEIVHGPYLLKYGTSLGSSIRVVTRSYNPYGNRKIQASSLSSYDANRKGFRQFIRMQGSTPDFYFGFSAGLNHFGNYSDGNKKEWSTAFKKYTVNSEAGFKTSPLQQIQVSYKGSFASDVKFPALPMDETKDNTHIFSAVYTTSSPRNTDDISNISAYFSSVYHKMDNRHRPQYDSVIPPYQGKMQAVAKVNTRSSGIRIFRQRKIRGLLFDGGFDAGYIQKSGDRYVRMIMLMDSSVYINEKEFTLWDHAEIMNTGLFAGFSSHEGTFEFSATIRTDLNYSTSSDTLFIEKNEQVYYDAQPHIRAFWSLGVNVAFNIKTNWRLTVGLGRGVRPPDLSERYIQFLATGFDRFDYLGNPYLKPEVNYQADLTVDYSAKEIQFFANFFRSDIRNFITGKMLPPSVARPQSMGASGVKQFTNTDRAIFYGFETGVTVTPVNNLLTSWTVGYTYAYFPHIEKIILINGQAAGTETLSNDPVPEMPALESLIRVSYQMFQKRLQPSFEIRAVAAQMQNSKASYEDVTPGFILANFEISWQLLKKARMIAGISNLFNIAYYEHLNRRIIGTNENFYEPGRTVFVNLRMKL